MFRKPSGVWAYRWYPPDRPRRQVGGFQTKGAASAALNAELHRAAMGEAWRPEPPTVAALVVEYLAQHVAEANTLDTLHHRLKHAVRAFGDVRVDRLHAAEIGKWRKTLPTGSAHYVHRAFRQVLAYAVRCRYLSENPAALIQNPRPKREEIRAFGSWHDIHSLAAELPPAFRAIPPFVAGTGLRPEEWIALERRDVDREGRVVSVGRVFTDGRVKDCGKTERSRRRIPMRRVVTEALDAMPGRLDTPLVFPSVTGGHLDLHNFRARHWKAALRAAGLDYRPPNALRHTYASFSIAAGISLFALARRMGTSVEMIDATYGHLAPDADEYELALLDTFDRRKLPRDGHGLGTDG